MSAAVGAVAGVAVDALAFAAEVAVYAAVGWWGWRLRGPRALRLLAAVAGVAAFALVWGWFCAPSAAHPLHGVARALLEICWFGGASALALRAFVCRPRPGPME